MVVGGWCVCQGVGEGEREKKKKVRTNKTPVRGEGNTGGEIETFESVEKCSGEFLLGTGNSCCSLPYSLFFYFYLKFVFCSTRLGDRKRKKEREERDTDATRYHMEKDTSRNKTHGDWSIHTLHVGFVD